MVGMRGAKRWAALGLVVAAVAAGVVAAPPPSGAAVQVVVDVSVLRVYLSGAAGDTATIDCSAGVVRVNAGATALSCASTTSIQVSGSDGPDTIHTGAVTAAAFPQLTQVSLTGGAGNDVITAAQVSTNLFGDDGDDTLTGGPGADYVQAGHGLDALLGGAGSDTIFTGTGSTVDAGPDDDVVWSVWPAGRAASIEAGSGTDEFRLQASQLDDKLYLDARPDGSFDVVDTMPTAADVHRVPASFEQLTLYTTVGNDLVWIDGLSPAISVSVVGSNGSPRLEVFAKGPFDQTPATITRGGYAAITHAGVGDPLVFAALPSANHAFVHAAAHDLGGAHLTTGQVAAVAAKVAGGQLTRSAYAQQLTAGPAWREAEAERVFFAYLHRGLDPSGRAHWAERLRTGTNLNTIRARVLGSSEYFRDRASNDHGRFVDAVYFDVLHRLPDPGGRAYWRSKLDNGTPREDLAAQLLGFDEPVREFIRYHYRDLVGRDPSAAEIDTWRAKVRTQATGERDLQAALVASTPYLTCHG